MRIRSLLPLAAVLLVTASAQAIPRYAARYGQDCNLCHANPTGGGMRSAYATQFLTPKELAMQWLQFEETELPNPQLNDHVLVGADIRTNYFAGDEDDSLPENFFHMQSDIYLQLSIGEKFLLYFDRGQTRSLESFGTGYVLPYNGYVKLGRFTPAFGWKFVDHNHATRERLGFLPPDHTDVGLEIGLSPGESSFQFSVLNGQPGSILDGDGGLAYVGRGEYRLHLGPANLAIGGSSWYQDFETVTESMYGGFGYANWQRFTWVGEVDFLRSAPDGGDTTTGLATSHELSVQLVQGFDLLASYDYHEPDLDFLTGTRSRWSFGFDSLPTPFLGLRVMWSEYDNELGTQVFQEDYGQLEAVAHFYY